MELKTKAARNIVSVFSLGGTGLNVTGDLSGTTIVAKTEKEIEMSKWKK